MMCRDRPAIEGNLEVSRAQDGLRIAGDPEGLRSLARLLMWLADVDQESHPTMPDGERCHVHLHAGEPIESFNSLTRFSEETELCRLDAQGTGEFPEKYSR